MTAGIDLTADPIASGRTAEVFAVGDDRILKLLRPGFDSRMSTVERVRTAAVNRATGLAPEVSGLVEVDGRSGVLFERVFGVSMLDLIMSDRSNAANSAIVFADLHAEVFDVSAADRLPNVKDLMAEKINNADLPQTQRTRAKDHMRELPDGDATLHGDYHPGNVIVTSGGPRVIDWGEASHGDAAADIARTLILLTPESAADAIPRPESLAMFISQFANAYVNRCVQVTAVTSETIAAWRLPAIAARLSEGITAQAAVLQAEVAKLTA